MSVLAVGLCGIVTVFWEPHAMPCLSTTEAFCLKLVFIVTAICARCVRDTRVGIVTSNNTATHPINVESIRSQTMYIPGVFRHKRGGKPFNYVTMEVTKRTLSPSQTPNQDLVVLEIKIVSPPTCKTCKLEIFVISPLI